MAAPVEWIRNALDRVGECNKGRRAAPEVWMEEDNSAKIQPKNRLAGIFYRPVLLYTDFVNCQIAFLRVQELQIWTRITQIELVVADFFAGKSVAIRLTRVIRVLILVIFEIAVGASNRRG